jgi:regulator of protease activity HflC (stomatin/prohibitin superfamily)
MLWQVPSGQIGAVTNCGKYTKSIDPGCHVLAQCFWLGRQEMAQNISVATQMITCSSECKTQDNVTLTVTTGLQFRVLASKLKAAVFEVTDPKKQMSAYVDDVLRSTLPTLTLDEAYSSKEKMKADILHEVRTKMSEFGYDVRGAAYIFQLIFCR